MLVEEQQVTTEQTEEEQPQSPDQIKDLGVYEPFDYTPEPFVTFTEKTKGEVLALCINCAKRDMAARRMEVEQAWEARLFKRGYQFLFPRKGGGWSLTSPVLGNRTWSQIQGSQNYETNIYGSHCDILTSALVRDIPECRFEPFNPKFGPDITAAEKAESFKEIFTKNNNLKSVHTSAADFMCTDGRVLFYTTFVLDGQRFGFEDEDTIAEDGSPIKKARGREVLRVFGKLEHKVPINTQDIHEMDFIQLFLDKNVNRAKAMFPWIAKTIKAGAGSVGEVGLDRIARINCALALEGGYVTGDSFNRETTISYTWLRPSAYYDEAITEDGRKELFESCPDGMLVVYAGNEFAFARNECMDDHLHVLQAFPGTGQNRIALMSKVLSVQKRLNTWIDLLNDFFIRTVPSVWMDNEVFNLDAIAAQSNVPGARRPFTAKPGLTAAEIMLQEPMPTNQPALPEFIGFFFNDYPEMLSGALPSLFGAESNTDTMGGIAIQRDQALGRLSSPWGALQLASAAYFRQAVMCGAKAREALGITDITDNLNGKTVTIPVADLKGNVLCYPDVDSNFPETWIQRSSRYQQVLAEAPANPVTMQLLSLPQNLKMAKDAAGLKDFEVPQADSVDKQIAEFEILLKSEPLPNPAIAQAKQQMLDSAKQAAQEGPESMQKFEQLADQAKQSISQLPQMVSTVQVMQDASEDHQTEAAVCFQKMNSSEGIKLKKEQPKIWENLHLHWQEHMTMVDKLKPAPAPAKPPSASIAVDKMPPKIAAQLVQQEGVTATAQDFMEQDAAETEKKITEKAADFGKGIGSVNSGISGA